MKMFLFCWAHYRKGEESGFGDNASEGKEDNEARGGDFLRHLESTAGGAGGEYE